jgi:hypothetical protein
MSRITPSDFRADPLGWASNAERDQSLCLCVFRLHWTRQQSLRYTLRAERMQTMQTHYKSKTTTSKRASGWMKRGGMLKSLAMMTLLSGCFGGVCIRRSKFLRSQCQLQSDWHEHDYY